MKKIYISVLALAVSTILVGCDNNNSSSNNSDRVEKLIQKMNLDQKVTLMHGTADLSKGLSLDLGGSNIGYVEGIPELGIPQLLMTNGSAGVGSTHMLTTGMPAPITLASTFSTDLAAEYAKVSAREARADNQDVLLAPMMNIARTIGGGRNFEMLGEDPTLISALSVAQIIAAEKEGVMLNAKHLVGNDQEDNRSTIIMDVDERSLRELYLPPFEATAKAGVASVMCSYNKVRIDKGDTLFACDHKGLLTDILRNEWGYEGFVMTDWFAMNMANLMGGNPAGFITTPDAIKAGLDMEMPGSLMFGDSLKRAVESGSLDISYVDNSVRRILKQMERFKMLDGPRAVIPLSETEIAKHEKVAETVAKEGAVLLTNDDLLPFDATDSSIKYLVIGQTAYAVAAGGGSSLVKPRHVKSTIDAIKEKVGDANVVFEPGIDLDGVAIPKSALSITSTNVTPNIGMIDFTVSNNNPLPPKNEFPDDSVWTGSMTPPETGTYNISIHTRNGKGSLKICDTPITANDPGTNCIGISIGAGDSIVDLLPPSLINSRDGLQRSTVRLDLEVGVTKYIQVKVQPAVSGDIDSQLADPAKPTEIRLAWLPPSLKQHRYDDAVTAAASADKVIFFTYTDGGESKDITDISLADSQSELIKDVSNVNPNTAVILNIGHAVEMPWLDKTNAPKAVLNVWYPGQEMANATADILFGDAEPGGRLPVTFPKLYRDYGLVTDESRYPGVDAGEGPVVDYTTEGLFIGYRWYHLNNVEPRFYFGHGLSYTTFEYSDLQLIPDNMGGYKVSFTVKNTGGRSGSDVPQVYLGAPNAITLDSDGKPLMFVERTLVAFDKVHLGPNEQQTLTLPVTARDLSYWDTTTHSWKMPEGMREVYLGKSADIKDMILVGETQ